MIKRFWPYWIIRVVVLAALIRFPFDWISSVVLAVAIDVLGGIVSSHIFQKAAEQQRTDSGTKG